jgi:hypothetical protein
MPWQWSTVRGILSLQPANAYGERLFTHRDVCIEATRQQGKTLIVVLLILFHLFVKPVVGRARPLKIVYTAQRWSTARDVFTRVVKVINAVPALKRKLARPPSVRDNHGVIELSSGATAEFAPRSQEFGRGVTELDILFLDEAYDIDPGIENDLTGAQSASENPQTIYLSTPPVFTKHPKCHSLADMHRLGFARAPLLLYLLFAAPRHMKRDDPKTWQAAQPSYDVATNEREVWSKLQKAKNALKRKIFDADYCGWGEYPPPELEDETEISTEKWAAMGPRADQARPRLVDQPVVVLEKCPSTGRWVIIGASRTTDGRKHLEVGFCEAVATAVIVARVVALVAAWSPGAVLIRSGSAAAEVIADLERAGVEVTTVNRPEVAQGCGGFLSAALDGKLSHCGQQLLADAASMAMKKELPGGGFVWQLVDEVSYPALIGASVAHWALAKFGAKPRRRSASPRGGADPAARSSRRRSDSNVMDMAF